MFQKLYQKFFWYLLQIFMGSPTNFPNIRKKFVVTFGVVLVVFEKYVEKKNIQYLICDKKM